MLLIPFLELLRESIDLQERSAHPEHQPTHYLLGVFLPDYWGRSTRGTLIEFPSALEERAYYVGALPLMLAVVALSAPPPRARDGRRRRARRARPWRPGIPPFYQLVSHTPGFSGTNTCRLAVFTVLCGALLAAWGLEDLMRPAADARRRRVVTAVCAGLLVLPLLVVVAAGGLRLDRAGEAVRMAWAFAEPDPAGAFTDRAASSASSALRPCCGGCSRRRSRWSWWSRLRGRLSRDHVRDVAVASSPLDLFRAGMGYTPAIRRSHATQPATGAIRFLQSRRPARFVGLDPATFTARGPRAAGRRHPLRAARRPRLRLPGRAALPRPLARAIAREPSCTYALLRRLGDPARRLRALGLLGVTYLLQTPTDAPCPACASPTRAATPASTEPVALPRTFLVGHQRSSRAPTRPAPPSPRPASGPGRPP